MGQVVGAGGCRRCGDDLVSRHYGEAAGLVGGRDHGRQDDLVVGQRIRGHGGLFRGPAVAGPADFPFEIEVELDVPGAAAAKYSI